MNSCACIPRGDASGWPQARFCSLAIPKVFNHKSFNFSEDLRGQSHGLQRAFCFLVALPLLLQHFPLLPNPLHIPENVDGYTRCLADSPWDTFMESSKLKEKLHVFQWCHLCPYIFTSKCACVCECLHAPASIKLAWTPWTHLEQSISEELSGNMLKIYGDSGEVEYMGKRRQW